MKVKRLKELLTNVGDDMEVFVRNSVNPCGNIQELEQVELSYYWSFGEKSPCLVLNTNSSKGIEVNEEDKYIDFIGKEEE